MTDDEKVEAISEATVTFLTAIKGAVDDKLPLSLHSDASAMHQAFSVWDAGRPGLTERMARRGVLEHNNIYENVLDYAEWLEERYNAVAKELWTARYTGDNPALGAYLSGRSESKSAT